MFAQAMSEGMIAEVRALTGTDPRLFGKVRDLLDGQWIRSLESMRETYQRRAHRDAWTRMIAAAEKEGCRRSSSTSSSSARAGTPTSPRSSRARTAAAPAGNSAGGLPSTLVPNCRGLSPTSTKVTSPFS